MAMWASGGVDTGGVELFGSVLVGGVEQMEKGKGGCRVRPEHLREPEGMRNVGLGETQAPSMWLLKY